jgi:hypothetical protein
MLPCLKTERVSLSPQFTSCSKKATIEQSEDETEESCKITVEDIHHDVSRRGQFSISISICIDCFLAMIQICRSFIGSLNRSEAS